MAHVADIEFPLPHSALPEADWADCYSVVMEEPFPTVKEAAEAIIARFPVWTNPALALRQMLVTPFGLKGPDDVSRNVDKVGIFPIISDEKNQLVAGFDDTHLDFRIVVKLDTQKGQQEVSLATIIKRHNRLGRSYLLAVLPFHKAIIRTALSKL
ncbi:MAG: DUF2867 domain-containing protein [Pseudomonadota bacterium]